MTDLNHVLEIFTEKIDNTDDITLAIETVTLELAKGLGLTPDENVCELAKRAVYTKLNIRETVEKVCRVSNGVIKRRLSDGTEITQAHPRIWFYLPKGEDPDGEGPVVYMNVLYRAGGVESPIRIGPHDLHLMRKSWVR